MIAKFGLRNQSVMHCRVKGHTGVIQGQLKVNLLRNALWPPNLVNRISVTRV